MRVRSTDGRLTEPTVHALVFDLALRVKHTHKTWPRLLRPQMRVFERSEASHENLPRFAVLQPDTPTAGRKGANHDDRITHIQTRKAAQCILVCEKRARSAVFPRTSKSTRMGRRSVRFRTESTFGKTSLRPCPCCPAHKLARARQRSRLAELTLHLASQPDRGILGIESDVGPADNRSGTYRPDETQPVR